MKLIKLLTRFFKTAPTGTAANLINEETIHRLCSWTRQREGTQNINKNKQKSIRKLQKRWQHINHLILDEVSIFGLLNLCN